MDGQVVGGRFQFYRNLVLEGVEVHAVEDATARSSYLIDQIREFAPDWVIISEDTGQSLTDAVLKVCPSRVVLTTEITPGGVG